MGRSALGDRRTAACSGRSRVPDSRCRKVSIHVPAYNEPPEMLIETLDALARLDYPDFEVLVIDNNTKDEAVWRPVEAHCARARRRASASSTSTRSPASRPARSTSRCAQTAPDAEVVAVIDSDYVVEPDWLRDLVPAFANPRTGDRAGAAGLPRRRRERLQGDVLRGVPRLLPHRHGHAQRAQRHHPARHHDAGAARRCSSGVRLGRVVHHRGRRARPAHLRARATRPPTCRRSYGRGLMPDTFIDFKKQRFRWALRRDADPAPPLRAAVRAAATSA